MATQQPSINSIADLYREYEQPLFRFLYRLSGEEQLARDLVQETFYQALISINRFSGKSKFSTWLYSIARNVHANWVRGARQRRDVNTRLAFQAAGLFVKGPEQDLEDRLVTDSVNQALQTLPEHYRVVILLKEVEQLTHEEISVILGKSVSSCKVLLHRAKQRFIAEYGKVGKNGEPL